MYHGIFLVQKLKFKRKAVEAIEASIRHFTHVSTLALELMLWLKVIFKLVGGVMFKCSFSLRNIPGVLPKVLSKVGRSGRFSMF